MRPIRTPFRFDSTSYDQERLASMQQGGEMLLDAILALQKRQHTVLSRLAPKGGQFSLWDHYPPAEVTDTVSACQYYYHSHRTTPKEHGHFHLFRLLHADGALRVPGEKWGDDEAPSHLIAISMSPQGLPIKVFCTNQWVTQGYWMPAKQILAHLDAFVLRAEPRWAVVSRWLAGFVQLFRPQIEAALLARDAAVKELRGRRRWNTFWADEAIEVINYVPIDLHRQIALLDTVDHAD
jgi:hypothetical protein